MLQKKIKWNIFLLSTLDFRKRGFLQDTVCCVALTTYSSGISLSLFTDYFDVIQRRLLSVLMDG